MSEANLDDIKQAIADRDLSALIQQIPYARFIGLDAVTLGDEIIFTLPKNDDNLGNPMLPALHGGVIGGFMETAAILHIMMAAEFFQIPRVVDFSLDYLRPGRHQDTYAKCTFVRQGRKIANVAVSAWQQKESLPIATARAHFLIV